MSEPMGRDEARSLIDELTIRIFNEAFERGRLHERKVVLERNARGPVEAWGALMCAAVKSAPGPSTPFLEYAQQAKKYSVHPMQQQEPVKSMFMGAWAAAHNARRDGYIATPWGYMRDGALKET